MQPSLLLFWLSRIVLRHLAWRYWWIWSSVAGPLWSSRDFLAPLGQCCFWRSLYRGQKNSAVFRLTRDTITSVCAGLSTLTSSRGSTEGSVRNLSVALRRQRPYRLLGMVSPGRPPPLHTAPELCGPKFLQMLLNVRRDHIKDYYKPQAAVYDILWRKVPESGARSVGLLGTGSPRRGHVRFHTAPEPWGPKRTLAPTSCRLHMLRGGWRLNAWAVLGSSGGVVNSLDFCQASLKSLGCFYYRCVLSSQWKAVTVNLRILHCQL